ncbi:hypothetical protein ENBRE01_2870, partial [Enteropsectra breve]
MENFYVSRENEKKSYSDRAIVYRDVEVYERCLIAKKPISKMWSAARKDMSLFSQFSLELEFYPKLIRSNEHEILLISDENMFYRINRYTESVEELGQIQDPIRDVLLTDEGVYILTTQELLHFNSYCELVNSVKVGAFIADANESDVMSFYKVNKKYNKDLKFKIMTFNDSIAVVYNHIYIFSNELKFISKLPQEIQDATFIKKYNRFACIKGDQIVFIEPNGLEHGDPLPTPGFCGNKIEQLYFANESLLVLADNISTRIYYMKNFYWYKKLEIPGRFDSINGETLYFNYQGTSEVSYLKMSNAKYSTPEEINKLSKWHSVLRVDIGRSINPFCVIDGNKLKYTNLYRAQIPPPFFYKELEFENNIKSVFYKEGLLFVYVDNSISADRDVIGNEGNIKSNKSIFTKNDNSCGGKQILEDESNSKNYKDNAVYIYEVNDDNFKLYKKYEIRNCDILSEQIIDGDRDSIVLRSNDYIHRIKLEDKSSDDRVFRTDDFLDETRVINACVIKGEIAVLNRNGMLDYKNKIYSVFDINDRLITRLVGDFSVKYIEENNMTKIFILANKRLVQIDVEDSADVEDSVEDIDFYGREAERASCVIANDVVSFICYKSFVIYNNKNNIFIYKNSKIISQLYADDNAILLMVNDNKIVTQSRFGSLESSTVKEFSRIRIEEMLREGRYREAADECDRNHISYDIFFNYDNGTITSGLDIKSIITELKAEQIFNLLEAVEDDNTKKEYICRNEFIKYVNLRKEEIRAFVASKKYRNRRKRKAFRN